MYIRCIENNLYNRAILDAKGGGVGASNRKRQRTGNTAKHVVILRILANVDHRAVKWPPVAYIATF
jgi:hypothetical protein